MADTAMDDGIRAVLGEVCVYLWQGLRWLSQVDEEIHALGKLARCGHLKPRVYNGGGGATALGKMSLDIPMRFHRRMRCTVGSARSHNLDYARPSWLQSPHQQSSDFWHACVNYVSVSYWSWQ